MLKSVLTILSEIARPKKNGVANLLCLIHWNSIEQQHATAFSVIPFHQRDVCDGAMGIRLCDAASQKSPTPLRKACISVDEISWSDLRFVILQGPIRIYRFPHGYLLTSVPFYICSQLTLIGYLHSKLPHKDQIGPARNAFESLVRFTVDETLPQSKRCVVC